MPAKRTYKNQITIPKDALKRLKHIRRKIRSLGLTEKDIDEAIRWARRPSLKG